VVYQLTGSAVMVGVLGFANFAPVFLLALPGGYLADRHGPRTRPC
jgi:MFS family permease